MRMDDYQKAVAGDGKHSYSDAPCAQCGDLDGCHIKREAPTPVSRSAPSKEEKAVFHRNHPMTVERRWNVPPHNSVHVVVSFHEAPGTYYLGLEDWDARAQVWRHREGSAFTRRTESDAITAAEQLWAQEQEASGGRSRYR